MAVFWTVPSHLVFALFLDGETQNPAVEEMMSAIWQFIRKYDFWALLAVWAGLLIAYEITGDATLPTLMTLIFILAVTRLAMHPMWKRDKQAEDEGD